MKTEIEKFVHPQLGTIRCKVDESGEPWFVGKDVADALGYANPSNALSVHVDVEDKTTYLNQVSGSNYKTKTCLINESGLYSLILSSKLESARQFKHWVTSDVLPTLRKHGMYATESTLEQMIADPKFGIELLKTLKEERDARLYAEAQQMYLENKVEEMEPKYDYCRTIIQNREPVTVDQIAKVSITLVTVNAFMELVSGNQRYYLREYGLFRTHRSNIQPFEVRLLKYKI